MQQSVATLGSFSHAPSYTHTHTHTHLLLYTSPARSKVHCMGGHVRSSRPPTLSSTEFESYFLMLPTIESHRAALDGGLWKNATSRHQDSACVSIQLQRAPTDTVHHAHLTLWPKACSSQLVDRRALSLTSYRIGHPESGADARCGVAAG